MERASEEKTILNVEGEDNVWAIWVDDLHLYYQRPRHDATSIKELALSFLRQGRLGSYEVQALRGVSLSIRKGEVYGVIGRNGAGKSTLFKVLSRLLPPTKGRVRIWGRVVPLLGVGAGFHPELTGRENVYLYSALLGRSRKRTTELFEEIVDFAELWDFIDAPLRTYSSGMVARLGFAVAMAERPDILLVDEVLAVGDVNFKDKCQARFEKFVREGSTIVIISHNLNVIRDMCERVTWLHKGEVMATGPADEVVRDFWRFMRQQSQWPSATTSKNGH